MTGPELARTLEHEYHCEECKRRPAVVIFDYKFLCARCSIRAARQLIAEGEKK